MFADDTKLFTNVPSVGDAALLQTDLGALMRWSEIWLIPSNLAKRKIAV